MEFVDLFLVALMPVIKVLLVTALGLLLAIDGIHLLGPETRQILNNLVFFVFSPALIFSNLSETITFQSLVTLWFMPVNMLLTVIIGSALAWIFIKLTRIPPHLQGLVIGCCSTGNYALLLIIVPAVCEESSTIFGDSSICSTNAEAYASFSMAVGIIYIWTYVYAIMSIFAHKSIRGPGTDDSAISIGSSRETSESFSVSCTEALLPSRDRPCSDIHRIEIELSYTCCGVSFLKKMNHCIKAVTEKLNLKMVFSPNTIAAIVGFVIGTVSPIRKLMIGDNAPLRVIGSSAALLGEAAIPVVTLIIGANLLQGLKGSRVSVSLIIVILAVRYILLPLLGIVIVKGAHRFGMVGSDPLYQFMLLLMFALPPAQNIGVMSQLFETGMSECSVIMLWTYAVASISLTLWTTFYMWLMG